MPAQEPRRSERRATLRDRQGLFFPDNRPQYHHNSNTEHAWMIRRQVDRLAIRMCPHASTTDDTVFMRYDNGKDYGSAITSGKNSMVRSCRERECPMRYWFSPGSDEDGGDAIWLNVVHRELPGPIAADHEAWLAASG
ncbi:hypothetical protein LTR17_016551 [Elasticomyces elasticus]|nr:hypothetical protein LTR17_016551 [Elasticomyces elasticus]